MSTKTTKTTKTTVKDNTTAEVNNTTVNTTAEVKESRILSELRRDLAPLNEVGKAKVLVDFETNTIKTEDIDVKMERAAALHTILEDEALKFEFQAEKESRAYVEKFKNLIDNLKDSSKNNTMISILISYVKTPKYYRETFLEVMEERFPVNFTNSSSTPQQGGICGDTLYALSLQGLLSGVDSFTENDIQYIIDYYFRPRVEKKAAARKSGIVVC